ncbi:toll-like receptor Tollo [Aphidius gifuensis]|uniref:toll-like receptor Tollo n=1 Tax=Aphidius gifuensis TaxID=684658 RepID=UPI001CDD4052|nr:toll-like receptor Tollo [Aphidius gifuensis]
METLTSKLFNNLKSLVNIELNRNGFTWLPEDLLTGTVGLESLSIMNNQLKKLPEKIFKDCVNLKTLDLMSNELIELPNGVFLKQHKLEVLNLKKNKIQIIEDGVFDGLVQNNDFQFMSNGLKINLEYNNISQVLFPDGIQYMGNTEYLDDSQTSVTVSIDNNPIISCNGPNHLKNINIKSLNSTTFKCLSNEANNDDKYCPEICECWMEPYSHKFIIDCSYKNLTTSPLINPPSDYYLEINLTVAMNLSEITIHDNPWKCDCDGIYLLKFLEKMKDKIPKMMKVTCDVNNLSVLTMTSDELCPSYAYIYVVLSLCIVVLVIIYTILCKYMRDVKIWLHSRNMCLNFITENDIDQEKLYDAFISYSHKDSNFVLDELIPRLENGPVPFKLCVHYRDWKAGVSITQQIVESINSSRRTIIILSANFLESIWGIVEFRTAYQLSEKENKSRIIMIVYGDIPDVDKLDDNDLKHYMKKTTYLEWKDQRFWKKLMYALPHSSHLKKQIDI